MNAEMLPARRPGEEAQDYISRVNADREARHLTGRIVAWGWSRWTREGTREETFWGMGFPSAAQVSGVVEQPGRPDGEVAP